MKNAGPQGERGPAGASYDDTEIREELKKKQDKLIAGDNITIVDGVISATSSGLLVYTVSFNTDGGTEVAEQSIVSGNTAIEPISTKEKYILNYWALDGVEYDFSTPVTANITLTAVWKREYTELEYLESTGTQYINTDIVPKLEHTYHIKFAFTQTGNNQVVFGSRSTGTSSDSLNQIYLNANNSNAAYYLKFFVGVNSVDLNTNTEANIIYTENLIVNYKEHNQNNFTDTATLPLYLFAFNVLGNVAVNSYIKLYNFKIYNGNTLIRDYIPVLDKNGVACLWDNVTENYFYNKGTGSFTAGPVV